MTTRHTITSIALGFNGTCDGQGYDHANPFSHDLSRPVEAWCGDFVTDIYKRAHIPLPSMQPGCRTGFAGCPAAVDYGRRHHATRFSWHAEPGDIVLFDWPIPGKALGDGVADHTEIVTGYHDAFLGTIGGNSAKSNVDGFRGEGGVHRHRWHVPAGQGNSLILAVINAAKVVRFGGPAHPTKPGTPLPAEPRQLMLKSPMMKGADVQAVQQALNQRNNTGLATDGIYDPATRDAVLNWQQHEQIHVDGIVGPYTGFSLGLPEWRIPA
jgi:Putative peptidoglycan binding domain